MVVILLLSPPPPPTQQQQQQPYTTKTTNGCDGGSNDSSTVSTTSTGDTVIPTIYTDNKTIPLPNEATYQHYQPPQPPASAAIAHRLQQQENTQRNPRQPHKHHQQHQQHHRNQQLWRTHGENDKQRHHNDQPTTIKPFNATIPNSSHLYSRDEGTSNAAHKNHKTHLRAAKQYRGDEAVRDAKIVGTQYPPRIIVSPPPPPPIPSSPPESAARARCDTNLASSTFTPKPPQPHLPESQPRNTDYHNYWCSENQRHQQQHNNQQQHQLYQTPHHLCTNPLPKPPRIGTAHTTNHPPPTNTTTHKRSKRHTVAVSTPQTRWSIPPAKQESTSTNYYWSQHVGAMPIQFASLPIYPYVGYSTPTLHQQQTPSANNEFYDYNYNNINNNNNTNNTTTTTTTTDFVRHVTRVNFYDVVTSQVEFEPKDDCSNNDDDNDECDTEAITKEEEWITKKKTELTTTRQIETRVKRQLVLEDGKVVEDSGPIVSTNTTEDTDKQETETTEKRDLGIPIDGIEAEPNNAAIGAPDTIDGQLAVLPGDQVKIVKKMVPRPADGLVHESNEKRVITHEEVKDYLETEDVRNLGDFSDETYVKAVHSGVDNLQEVLLAAENQKQLVPFGPRIIANTTKSFKTIDSEDVEKRCLIQADGQLVTESKTTTEHEVIVDRELPEEDDRWLKGSLENIETVKASQHLSKEREEHHVDQIVDGKVVNTEMRYAAETMQIEKDGSLERPGDWDSLSDRMRKLRRPHQKNTLQTHKEATLLADRKDALTKRPLDFDREEETRKGETIKWLESHFGSESTASNDSREDDAVVGAGGDIEPTKKTFFNVTIKSNQTQTPTSQTNGHRTVTASTTYDRRQSKENIIETQNANGQGHGRSKYYQGISNWTDRKEAPPNHFASKAFREDLQETVERNRLRRNGVQTGQREKQQETNYLVGSSDTYVSREDILQQKQRQSLSSQFLAKGNRNSRDRLNELDMPTTTGGVGHTRHMSGSRNNLRYGGLNGTEGDNNKRSFIPTKQKSQERDLEIRHSLANLGPNSSRNYEFGEMRSRSYERTLEDTKLGSNYDLRNTNSLRPLPAEPDCDQYQTSTLGRPTVPQRRRVIEKKLRQQHSISPPQPQNVPLDRHHVSQSQRNIMEPPPDYSPPPRSRSSSPQVDYVNGVRNQLNNKHNMTNTTNISYGPPPNQIPTQSSTTLVRKQNQRTRFAPNTAPHDQPHSQSFMRPIMATQTTQTTASTISNSTATSHKSSKMGQVIGNSLRKLVNKIRSASAERKMRMKSRSKSREQSPSPQVIDKVGHQQTTYQQYNLIDSHIGGQVGGSNESELESMPHESIQQIPQKSYTQHTTTVERNGHQPSTQFKRANSADPFGRDDRDAVERGPSPRQRYYLGEDPYSSTLYGKENLYGGGNVNGKRKNLAPRESLDAGYTGRQERNMREANVNRRNEEDFYKQNVSANTLGRYQRTSQNFAASTPNLNQDHRTTQTLPRKLQQKQQQQQQQLAHHTQPQYISHSSNYQRSGQRIVSSGYSTLGHPEQRMQYHQNQPQYHQQQQQPHQQEQPQSLQQHQQTITMGPAKPARTYAKALNRSKSFNVHAMNGSHDPSPIYIEKLTKNNYTNNYNSHNTSNLLYTSQAYKSNPHIYSGPSKDNSLQSGLKSPSIVNLISRSQKDLTKIDSVENEHIDSVDKKQAFMRGLHQQAPDLYRTLHGNENYHHSRYHHHQSIPSATKYQQLRHSTSLDAARSPIEINKDTTHIVSKDSSSNDDYVYSSNKTALESATANRRILYKDEQGHHSSGATIISVRNMDVEK